MSKTIRKHSDLGTMKALEIGESAIFPIKSMCSIRTNASNLNAMRGTKSLTTTTDSENGTITVSRIA